MGRSDRPSQTQHLYSWDEEQETLARHIRAKASPGHTLNILEAGCGCSWDLDLADVYYHLTGVDVDEDALNIRRHERRDLDEAIVGDLRTIELGEGRYDVIFNSFVLEHIADAERVLENFMRWLRPGGILVLRFPNRDSVYGYLTRLTPLWIHVLYKRFVIGFHEAGQPGRGPFPTVHDPVVSRSGIRGWCGRRGFDVAAEYTSNYFVDDLRAFSLPVQALVWLMHVLSFGRLAADHNNLAYVIEKPVSPPKRVADSSAAMLCRA